ncbi:hypothetical protein M8C17_00790 [Micromonospora sp. RHAY321]|uniref:hypothetical protein n=1 Tax=Micromonospora sp. RHAY321 TaxID=2944807 RepID=UPI00207C7152|nr:hypothetical protein [Micromonospora sp. RHAY321]MCO1593703.1 hypothetical protein [Micromonospora sp. RHAY321]
MNPTIAALLGSAITAFASLFVVMVQSRLRRRHREQADLQRAYILMLSGALRLAHKAEALRQTKYWRSGLREVGNQLLGGHKPLDPMVLHDWLARDMATVEAAWSEIWTSGDQDGIALANGLMTAFNGVMDAAMKSSGQEAFDATDEMLVASRRLGEARGQLALHARRVAKLGPRDVDLFTDREHNLQPA